MGNIVCPVVTPVIREIYEEILRLYPEASKREGLTDVEAAEWVGMYSSAKSIPIDTITKKDANGIVNHVEKHRNMDGRSFKHTAFIEKQKAETATDNSNGASEVLNTINPQLVNHLKSTGINVFNRAQMEQYLKEHPNTLLQQALEEQWEMQDIKAKAIADGTFMKAPNGNPTNLTERQWLQVRTKNFINWFGDWINDPANASKVVDENGEPKVVYHGGKYPKGNKFNIFDVSKSSSRFWLSEQIGSKSFFTDNNYLALKMSKPDYYQREKEGLEGSVYEVFLDIKEPLTLNANGKRADYVIEDNTNILKDSIGTIINNIDEDGIIVTDYITSNPNQVKSATDNNGIFSTENDDIQMSVNNKKALNSLDIIDESIKTGNWNNKSIEELDNLNNEDYGKILKRFSQEELGGSDEILKQSETIVSRGSRGSDTSNSQENRERAEQQIESWAKENGLWYNDYQESKDGSLESVIEADGGVFSNKSGSESLVYWMNDGTTVKAVDASHYEGNVQKLLDKVVLHNSLFPETAYSVLGFGRDRGGAFRIIIKQQIVKGTRPTTEEILSFIEKLGLEKKKGWYYTKDGKRLTDLNYGNIIKVSENTFAVIDCDVEFTPEYLNSIKDFPQLFATPQGEIYGFVDKEGNMYLDETIINASHLIHEYTHLWDRALEKTNPQLWKRGVNLMQEGVPGLWNEIANSENYGKLWQSKVIKGDKLVNLIASEVHARLVGENGAKLLDQIVKEKGKEGIIAKLKQWILDAWKELKATFSNWSQEEIDKLTLKDFNHMTVRDFADGVNPNRVTSVSSPSQAMNLTQGKTAQYGVQIDSNLFQNYRKWQSDNPNGIVAYRVNRNAFNTPAMVQQGIIGNPFDWQKYGTGKAGEMFYNWLTTGNNYNEPLATDEFRNAVIKKINNSKEDSPILYYKELERPSHATVIGYLIRHKDLLYSSSPSNAASASPLASGGAGFDPVEAKAESDRLKQQQVNTQQIEESKPKAERPQSAAYKSALKVENSRVAQFKRVFSPQQIKDRGAMISNIFSRIIDDALWDEIDTQLNIIESDTYSKEEKTQAEQRLHEIQDPLTGRQTIAQKIGIPEIMKEIKQQLQWDLDAASEDVKQLWQNTIDYFEELFNTQATLDIEEREGIRIIGLQIDNQNVSEDENEDLENGDDEVGNIVSGNDGWNFKVRYTNPFDSLSRKVRGMLYEIERPNAEKDDLGQTRYYPMGQIYASLLSYLAKNMQDSDTFMQVDHSNEGQDRWGNHINDTTYPNGYPTFPVLEQMKIIYPWVQQVIDRLTDDYMNPEWNTSLRYPSTGGAMASQFYTNFRKAYIPYGKIQIGNSKFGVTPLNYQMEERAQLDKLEANYNNRMILSEHSIYDSDGKVSKENANWLKQQLKEAIDQMDKMDLVNMPELLEYNEQHPDEKTLTEDDVKEYNGFLDNVRMLLQSFGIDATQDSVATYSVMDGGKTLKDMLSDLHYIADTISKVSDDKIDSFNYMVDTRDSYNRNMWGHFFDGKGLITDASYMQSFYDSASKKTKYSYSADNYLMKTFRGVCMGTLEQRRAYIDEHYGKYEWFRNQKTGEWRNKWLEFWYNYTGEQKEIPYRNIDNVTEYGEDSTVVRQYSNWTSDDVWQVQNRSYNPEGKSKIAFYLAPIFSDSPMSMTVKGPRMSMEELLYGYNDASGSHHQGALVNLVNQELWRIQYVQRRAEAIREGRVKPIANFDTGVGSLFCFLPELNTYTFEDGERFLDRMMRLKKEKATVKEIEGSQIKAIRDIVNSKMREYVAENDEHYSPSNPIQEEQYYNMIYANAAITQMTTVDLAFYGKGQRKSVNDTINQMTIDFQKRFKEVYAGGIQLNTNSKYGKKAENILMVSDDIITSPSYDKIASIIDNSKTLTEADKKDIKELFQSINVADAQAIRSMHSFRSILDMMGNWTDEMEQALQHFKDGTWDRADFDTIYQIIKPFVYSVIERSDGFGSSILVPQQNKNSEICALMMYDIITNGLGDSPVYKAFSKFMENNLDADGNYLIDMIQYESAGKVGNQGAINISFNPNKVVSIIDQGFSIDGEEFEFSTAYVDGKYLDNSVENAEANYKAIKEDLDKELAEGKTTQEEYNKIMSYLRPTEDEVVSMLEQTALVTNPDGTKSINTEIVHTIPFDNYYQQQPTPEHHMDESIIYGSQSRNIAVADLPDDFEMSVKVKGGTYTFKGKDAVVDFYYELLNENLIEDFFGKGGLKDIFSSKEALRDAVTEIVRGNPKYGRDFAEALQLDNNGNFVLSPNSPTIFNLMQEIITSFFKNRITKQTINGAALIQAAGIGLDEDLRMVFDKDGNLAGAECLMPITSRKFFEPLLETKVINGKEEKVLNPEKLKKTGLDKAVGYRIPTENKSSMMPLIIKGFTPLQNGSAIVLPAEITTIAGSDFDVDKMYVMLLSSQIQEYDYKAAREAYAREDAVYKEMLSQFTNSQLADDLLDVEPQSFKDWFNENKEDFRLEEPIIRQIKYDFNKSPKENSRKARNNMLIQMTFGILTSKTGSEQVLNPQGFKDFKRAAKISRILTDKKLREQLIKNTEGINPGVLPSADKIIEEFLALVQEKYPDKYNEYKKDVLKLSAEKIQELYIQAVTAGNKTDAIKLLLNSSTKELVNFIDEYSAPESPVYPQTFAHSHAKNMAGSLQIGVYAIQASMCAKYQRADVRLRPEQQFTLNGRVIANVDVSDNGKRLKNEGQMVGASADNGKDPNLSDAGSTMQTAPIIGYMLRTGMSHLEAALIINQPHMKNANWKSQKGWQDGGYFGKILGKNPLATPVNVTTDMLIKSLFSPFELTPEEDKAIAGLCYRVLMQHEAQEYLTQISRADSPNGAMQNSYAKARIQRYKVDLFNAKMGQDDFPFVRIKEVLSNDAVNTKASEEIVREQLKGQRMGLLHGMYALGINSFDGLVSPYFFGAKQWFDDRIVKPILYNLNEKLPDTQKEKIVDGIYKSYITYMLSASPLFGNEEDSSMKQKRDYYLETFPSDYQKIIQENEDIRDLLGNILQVKNFGSRKRIILQDVGSLGKGQKQDIQRRFDDLLYIDNPDAKKLAKDLLIYSYFDNGLQFTHDSFSHLFTTLFLTSFPAYTETLNMLEKEITPEEEQNFIQQFLLTYPEAAYKVDGIINSDNHVFDDGNTIKINLNDKRISKRMINEVMSPNPKLEGINVYPYIQYNGEVFVLDQTMFDQYPGTPIYHKLTPYQTYSRLPLFNIEMSVAEMAKEFPLGKEQQQTSTPNSLMAHNEGDGDPNVSPNSMYPEVEDINSIADAFDPVDTMYSMEAPSTDAYQSEGEGELRDPFCGV